MSLNRAVFCVVFTAYLLILRPDNYQLGLAVIICGYFITAGIFAHILYSPASNTTRRLVAMFADMSVISYEMHLGGAVTSVFYPLILWTAFGNGLRFGLPSLLRSAILGVVGFSLVVATTPFWIDNPSLTTGLLIGLILLPLYAMILLKGLSAAKLQAEAANAAKTLFLARVSHELRTPLHAIIGTASLLERTDLSRGQQDMSKTIMDASHSLLAMIEDLLQTSAIESGKFPFNVAEFDLFDLLVELRSLVVVNAANKGLHVGLHVAHSTPARIQSDQRRLREIILNLAGNALKFTKSGGVLISVSVVDRSHSRERLRFEVADTGIGIAKSAHETIFQRFVQADTSIHDQFGGTGLGLSICKQLVETMGGQIGVESELGSGSCFWFEIDCVAVAPPPAVAPATMKIIAAFDLDRASMRAVQELADRWGAIVRHERTDPSNVRRILKMSASEQGPLIVFHAAHAELSRSIDDALNDIGSERLPALVAIQSEAGTDDGKLRWIAPTTIPSCFSASDLQEAANIVALLNGGSHVGAKRERDVAVKRVSRHVLVVDDSRINQQVIARILESVGHSFKLVSDGEAALDALDAEQFDLVLMDVNMQGMDGIETTKLYRFTALGKRHVPIMALTADATPEMAQRCLEAGMDRCIIKPVHAETLLSIIDGIEIGERDDVRVAADTVVDSVRNLRAALQPLPSNIAIFDSAHLDSLRDLGGPEFVSQLIADFAGDARALVEKLFAAVDSRDLSSFRSHSHAIASASGNLGAARVRHFGLAMERFSAEEFGAFGMAKALELEREVECLTEASAMGQQAVS
jgi:two-component system sensor histidine kinase RpfC